VDAVASANPRTIVVLETGGPVLMPWIRKTTAVLEAWYAGQQGGEAIAEILSGAVNPSGRLPVTFPDSEAQLPHPKIEGDANGAPIGPVGRGGHYGAISTATYDEGAAVGYKWFFERGERPMFPFGFGLSYAAFALDGLAVSVDGGAVTASVNVRNSGDRTGAATPQFYVSGPEGASIPLRLAGWSRIDLAPGAERRASVSIDPRLLATFDEAARRWRIKGGVYRLTAGFDAERRELSANFALDPVDLPP
jgi:beta-glucosidase